MKMSFGKYQDKEVAWVILKDLKYINWMIQQKMTDKKEMEFAFELINRFDQMPFINARCSGPCNGKNQVTRLSLYKGRYNSTYWFCDECELHSAGAFANLNGVAKISEIISHPDCNEIVAAFAKAKGATEKKQLIV